MVVAGAVPMSNVDGDSRDVRNSVDVKFSPMVGVQMVTVTMVGATSSVGSRYSSTWKSRCT